MNVIFIMLAAIALVLAAILDAFAGTPAVQMRFTTGSRCGVYVGKVPVELSLNVKAGQVVQAFPNRDPDQSKPIMVQLAYPGEDFSPTLPAAFESRRVRGGGTYRYRILNSGTAIEADVRFCVVD